MRYVTKNSARMNLLIILSLIPAFGCEGEHQSGDLDIVLSGALVCDPFGAYSQVPTGDRYGLYGKMAYIAEQKGARPKSLDEVEERATAIDAHLYLSHLFAVGRTSEFLGFLNKEDSTPVTTGDGRQLYKDFYLDLNTHLRLRPQNHAGKYEFALIASAGATLDLDLGDGFVRVVDNDGIHPTRIAYSEGPVELNHDSQISARIRYFAGRSEHQALVLLWREWGADGSYKQLTGNGTFWHDHTVPRLPKKAFEELMFEGWKLLEPENFILAEEFNPCAPEDGGGEEPEVIQTAISGTSLLDSLTNQTSAEFWFQSNIEGATFECSLDGAAPVPCDSPVSYSGLSNGSHLFNVWAISPSGTRDENGAFYLWTVDSVAPFVPTVSYTATSTSMTISWTTSEEATTLLRWGADPSLPNTVPEDDVYKTSHSVTITDLQPDTIYYFQMAGRDRAGNTFQTGINGGLTNP